MDGASGILNGCHAFEYGKQKYPTNTHAFNIKSVFEKQYKETWEYIYRNFPDIKINNISN
jgi:hypothetical protein